MFDLSVEELTKAGAEITTREIKQQPELWVEAFENYEKVEGEIKTFLDKIVEKKVIGIKQCLKFIKLGKGKVLYVANDADARLISPLIELAEKENIKIVEISTMKELGLMSGIEVKSAATLIIEK